MYTRIYIGAQNKQALHPAEIAPGSVSKMVFSAVLVEKEMDLPKITQIHSNLQEGLKK